MSRRCPFVRARSPASPDFTSRWGVCPPRTGCGHLGHPVEATNLVRSRAPARFGTRRSALSWRTGNPVTHASLRVVATTSRCEARHALEIPVVTLAVARPSAGPRQLRAPDPIKNVFSSRRTCARYFCPRRCVRDPAPTLWLRITAQSTMNFITGLMPLIGVFGSELPWPDDTRHPLAAAFSSR